MISLFNATNSIIILIKLPSIEDVSHCGLAVIQHLEHLFEAWGVRIKALVCQYDLVLTYED
jgi:hypothetical protein